MLRAASVSCPGSLDDLVPDDIKNGHWQLNNGSVPVVLSGRVVRVCVCVCVCVRARARVCVCVSSRVVSSETPSDKGKGKKRKKSGKGKTTKKR